MLYTHIHRGGSRFTVVSMQNRLLLCYYLLIIVLFSTKKTVNLLYPHLVHVLEKLTKNFFSKKMDVFLKCKAEFIPNKIKTLSQKCLFSGRGIKHCFSKLPSYQNCLESNILKILLDSISVLLQRPGQDGTVPVLVIIVWQSPVLGPR